MKQYMLLGALAFCCMAGAAAQEKLFLTQTECRQMALHNNEDLRKSDIALRQAQLDKEIAFRAYLPKLDGMVSGTYMLPDMDLMGTELQMRGMYMAGITLVQPVYAGGKVRTANRLARIGEEAAAESLRQTRMSVIAEADNAYWSYIAVSWQVRMLQSYQAQMDTLHRQVAASLSAGMATDNDLLRIDAKRSEIRYQLQKARNGANLCRLSLCSVIGCPLDTEVVPTDTIIPVQAPAGLDADISLRPELRLLQQQVNVAEEEVKDARSGHLPQVGISAGYLYYGNIKIKGSAAGPDGSPVPYTQKLDNGMWLAMASINVPIFHWGEGVYKVKSAKAQAEAVRYQLDEAKEKIELQVNQCAFKIDEALRKLQMTEKNMEKADENLRYANLGFKEGVIPTSNVLEAQTAWLSAQSEKIDAQIDVKLTDVYLKKALGKLGQ